MMKLYSGPLSMFGAKVEIAVAEKGAPCEIEMAPFSMRSRYEPKHEAVRRINPKGQVPVLIDGGAELFDSTQIFEYLEDAFPDPPLWPREPQLRAFARQLELKSDEVFFPHVVRLMRPIEGSDGSEAIKARSDVDAYHDQMETILDGRRYLAGTFSYADIAFFMAHYFAAWLGADLQAHHKRLDAWRRDLLVRPAFSAVAGAMTGYLATKRLQPPAFAVA